MSLTQNEKIRQVTENTVIVGVDIASETHWARIFDWRGIELSKTFSFENSEEGFCNFRSWIGGVKAQNAKDHILIGAEPTGHYWFGLAAYLKSNDIKLVNPYHVKQTKELDDNHPSKTDRKDPKTIAKLVLDGRYSEPYIPEGIYAELRVAMNCRWRVLRELTAVKNQVQRWLKIYFPEHQEVFGKFDGVGSLAILRKAPTPAALVSLGVDGINAIWRQMKLRAVGKKRAARLFNAAQNSIGCVDGIEAAVMELQLLLDDYDTKMRQYDTIMSVVEGLCEQLPEVAELLKIKSIGLVTVAGFLAEVGDIRCFDSPKQVQKLAGLAIRENSSGKYRGQTTISKRGRARLRAILFRAAIALSAKNPEFQSIHRYYTTREKNPLKKKQSIIAMACKLIRVFYAVMTKGYAYDPDKMLADIHRNEPLAA
jgi:transposase